MHQLLFGTAGIPLSTPEPTILNAIPQVRRLGLGAMELEFVRSVHVTPDKAPLIKQTAAAHNVILTCHGQYFVNLNAQEEKKLQESVQRILHAARICQQSGVWSLCYHMGYYMKQEPAKVYETIRKNVKDIIQQFREEGITLWLRPETGGKVSQFGELIELIKLSQDCEQVLPCIDWAHHHARSNGKYNTTDEFRSILSDIEKGLGREALENMHMHVEGIAYNHTGERHHLELDESDFNYRDMIAVWKEFKIKGVAISESPNVEEDALRLKGLYEH